MVINLLQPSLLTLLLVTMVFRLLNSSALRWIVCHSSLFAGKGFPTHTSYKVAFNKNFALCQPKTTPERVRGGKQQGLTEALKTHTSLHVKNVVFFSVLHKFSANAGRFMFATTASLQQKERGRINYTSRSNCSLFVITNFILNYSMLYFNVFTNEYFSFSLIQHHVFFGWIKL